MTILKANNPVHKTFDGLMNELFHEIPSSFGKAIREDLLGFPPVNIIEKANHYHLELYVPGWEKTDFNINLDGKLLTISAVKKEEAEVETDKTIKREFRKKSFSRSFTIDEMTDTANIVAKYEHGILLLHVPKMEEVKQPKKEIVIQ